MVWGLRSESSRVCLFQMCFSSFWGSPRPRSWILVPVSPPTVTVWLGKSVEATLLGFGWAEFGFSGPRILNPFHQVLNQQ